MFIREAPTKFTVESAPRASLYARERIATFQPWPKTRPRQTAPAGNRLGQETSPYLLQHKDNPVHWQAWGPEALAQAQAEQKPILLSVGYAACHWCHVMAHESFENEATAALMNELFVNIKVDREERPDLDAIYQSALALLGQQGGWPLTMFLTPDGEPFWGGTYFPPEPRWGRPGFPQVLRAIADTYHSDPDKVATNVAALQEALGKLASPEAGAEHRAGDARPHRRAPAAGGRPRPWRHRRARRNFRRCRSSSCSGAPGSAAATNAIATRSTSRCGACARAASTIISAAASRATPPMPNGWCRISRRCSTTMPRLLDLLTLVWQESRKPLYEQRIREIVAWLLREMLTPAEAVAGRRAFASALDADSEGEEGKFYVWTEAEIDEVLGADAPLFKQHYDVRPEGNWEEHTILNRSARPLLMDDATEAALARARAKLLARRDRRIRPGFDDKVLADWNGLMIAALARAGALFDEPALDRGGARAPSTSCARR